MKFFIKGFYKTILGMEQTSVPEVYYEQQFCISE